MAKTKKTLEELNKKYGIKGSVTPAKNNNGKQSTSASQKSSTPTKNKTSTSSNTATNNNSKSALDKLNEKYGIKGTSNTSNSKKSSTTTNKTSNKPTSSTTKKNTAFNTETKNAYTSAKNKATTKTTIKSNLSEKDRKARIKEIDSELSNLNRALSGYSRAGAYGTSEAMKKAKQDTENKIAELSKEKKNLERVGTFSASELKQFEVDDAKAKLSSARQKVNSYGQRPSLNSVESYKQAVSEQYNAQQELNLLEREKAQYKKFEKLEELNAHTKKVTSNKDFAQNSKYSPNKPKTDEELKAEGYKQDREGNWYKTWGFGYRESYTGEDSTHYTYINDESKRAELEADMQLVSGTNTYRDMGYHTLTDEEKGAYNYLYHQDRKNGTNTAEEYLNKITPLLQQRAMELEAKYYAELSKESPVLMSGISLGTNLQNAMMFPAKVAATATGTYEDMPALDTFGNRTQAIRGGVSEDMGTVGKLLYNAGMSIGDMGVAMAVGGGNAKVIQAIMSSSAGSSTISEAKNNGASDGKALVLGLGSAAIEWATEKYSVEAILKEPKTIKGFILANTFTEATEEGASNISNLALDAIVSELFDERNDIEQRIDYLVLYEGKTEEEALQIAVKETLQSLGEDVLVGGITGFGMSGAKTSPIIVQKGIDAVRNKDTTQAVSNAPASNTQQATPSGQQAAAPATLEQAAREVVAERNKKSGTPLAQRLEAQSQNNEPIAVADVKKATGFGENGAKLVTEIANRDGVTFSQAEGTVKTAYLAGFANVDGAKIKFATDSQIDAFTAGKKDRLAQDLSAKEKAKSATVYKGAFTENEYTKNYTDAEKTMISTVAKSLGMDVSVVDKIIANEVTKAEANAKHSDGRMEISSTAEKVIHELVLHEGGHRMKQLAPTEFGVLMDALYARSKRENSKYGLPRNAAFDNVKAEHDRAGITMDTSSYFEEFAVRELETIFDSAESFNAWYSEMSTNQQVKTAWQKFMDFISKVIEDIKRTWSQRNMTAEEKAQANRTLKELERIKELYTNAYKAAENAVAERANAQNEGSIKTNSAKNLEIKTNEEYNGNINHSLKKKSGYNEYNTIGMQWAYDADTQIGDRKVLYNSYTNKYVLVQATKDGVGFVEVKSGVYNQMREEKEYYETEKQTKSRSDGTEETVDKVLHDFGVGQNDNIGDNVDAGNRGTGKQDAELLEGKSDSHRTTDTQTSDGNLEKRNFSLKKTAPTFYSHMGKTIDEMKQDKIGANSVVSYLKGKGVKNEEIKWSGIEEFLQGKKSVSKAELQEFVAGSMLQIDVKSVNDDITINYTQEELAELDAISEDLDNAWFEANDIWNEAYGTDIPIEILGSDDALPAMTRYVIEQHGGLSRFEGISHLSDAERKIYDDNNSITRKIKDLEERQADIRERATARRDNTKQTKYHKYTLDGGSGNYRELLFKLPNSEYTNDAMSMHWGEGGVLAHARIQDFDVDGQKMLFIEEIQSDWHNEGAKKGYVSDTKKLKDELETLKKKNRAEKSALIKQLTQYFEGKVAVPEEEAKRAVMFSTSDTYMDSLVKKYEIPTELVKRIKNHHESQKGEAKLFQKSLAAKKGVEDAPFRNNYHEYVLKNLLRMAAEDGYDSIGWTTADIQSDRWSGDYAEGYRIEYDQDIPKFLNKYGKKWGAKVGKTEIGKKDGGWYEVEGTEVWTMPITDSMKNSVLYEGQPMFSLKKPVEETKNLIALHNMQSSELERTLDLGGLPMPSIAIIKAQSGHSEYGDVSLVFDKSVIDPKASKLNKVYGGDAWTPTYPKIEYKPNAKIAKKISDKYYDFSRKFGYDESKPLYSYVYDLEEQLNRNKGEAGLINELYEDTRVMQLYLLDSGKNKVDTINKETRTELSESEVEMNEYFINSLGADVVDEVMWDGDGTPFSYRKNYLSKYEGAIRETYKNLLSEVYKFSDEQVQNVLDSTKSFDYLKFVRDAYNYRQNGRVTIKTEADYEATQKAIREAAGEDYRKWVDSLFKGIEEKSGIRNNVDYFNNSGNRRSWEALHWENNLENVIKVMKDQADVGSVGFFSGQNIWGVAAKNYGSIEEIKADSDRLQRLPEEEYNKIKEGFGQRLSEIAHSIMDKSERNPFIASDNAMECIVDAVRNSKTKSGILNSLRQYQQLTVTETTVDDIVALVNDISNMPTEYFEAKPKRAVELNEIATAIIPDNISQATKTRLDDMGIKYVEYEAGNEQARLEVLNSLEDVQFSLKGGLSDSEIRKAIADNKLSKYVESGKISTERYKELTKIYGAIPKGERPHRDIKVPSKTADDKKVSQTVRTILEAKATPDEAVPTIEKMVEDGIFSYDVYTDKQALNDAKSYIKEYGWDESLDDWFDAVNSGEVSKELTTMGWALYNNAANIAATTTSETERTSAIKTSLKILDAMVRHQRSAAQALQATRILKKLSPETQLYGIQKSVSALQNELTEKYGDKAPDLKIDEELAEQFINAKTPEERAAIEEEIYKDIGRQMPSRFIDKWNAWRYLAMLGNPRTHIRNIVGNAGFAPVVLAKDITATAIESVVHRVSGKKTVRGKSLITGSKADRALLKAAWGDYGNVADMISNGGKYNDSAIANQQIEEGRQIFKFKPLEWARKGNSRLLEKEDMWFSKPHYAYALAQYCKANNITAEQIKRGKAIAPARDYAIKEAQKATYRDTNAFSQMVSEWGRNRSEKNVVKKAFNTVIEGILPFRKTPANILVRGVEYSPLGLLKGLSYDLYQVSKGKMSATTAIDNISAGLTGTGLLALGVLLAAQGLIRGHGEDDKDEKEFKELMGHQAYSLELPNGESITLDWLAPEALPFFVGVNIWETTKGSDEEANLSTILGAVTNISEPMLEMSCLQSLNDLFEGIGYASSNDTSGLVSVISSAATSYLTQGLPTLLGQAERTGEENRMSTYTEKDSFLTGDMQYTLGKASAKIPFWDYNQIPYIDAWGRKEASGTALKRGLNNFLNPAYTSTIDTSKMEKELLRLYEKTGDGGVFPERAGKYFTVDGKRKDLTAEEYVRYATLKGEKSYKLVSNLVKSNAYSKLSNEEKAKAIKETYDYANQKAKEAISKYKPETWVTKADEFGSNVGNYISFKTEVSSTKQENGGKISKTEVVDIILDMAQNDAETWKMYLSMYDSDKDIYAYNKGIEGEDYMDFLVALDDYDKPTKSGKYGTYTQEEAERAIRSLEGLSRQEKAVLFQSVNTSWKKNPFK